MQGQRRRPLGQPIQQGQRLAGDLRIAAVGHPREVGDGRVDKAPDAEIGELVADDHRDVLPRIPREAPREHVRIRIEQGVEARLLRQGERALQPRPHDGPILGVERAELGVERVEVGITADDPVEGEEAPRADVMGLRRGGPSGCRVDDEHVAGQLLAEGRHLRRSAVGDEPIAPHGQPGVLVAEGDIVDRSILQRVLKGCELDDGRVMRIGGEDVERTVPHDDPHRPVGSRLQRPDHLPDEVGQRRLGAPRGRDELHPGPDLVDPRLLKHVHVRRAEALEEPTAIDRHRIERVVVAREEVDRQLDRSHRLQRPADRLARDETRLEDVTRDHDELAARRAGHGPDRANRIDPRRRVARLGLPLEEVSRHAELPVARVHETDHVTPSFPHGSRVDPQSS